MMRYPQPQPEAYFSYNQKKELTPYTDSYNHYSDQMKEYCQHITKHQRIFRYIPGLQTVYLCNSMTFNALKPNSDIDIVCVTKKDMLWVSRLFLTIITFFLWIKRYKHRIAKKRCLSFWMDEESQSLGSQRIAGWDVYLAHRVRHLVCLYQRNDKVPSLWSQNKRISNHFAWWYQQYISLPLTQQEGSSIIQKYSEHTLMKAINTLIYYGRKSIMTHKAKQDIVKHKNIIIQKNIVKLFHDKRQYIQKHYHNFVNKTNSYQT